MSEQQQQWLLAPTAHVPEWVIQSVRQFAPNVTGYYVAQILWQRGIQDQEQLAGFLNPRVYQPASPFEFGQEMQWAVERLKLAHSTREKVAIWGDFDADGITSTGVLWDGLSQFFPANTQLAYHIPNRLQESHGLNCQGINKLSQVGIKLIVTCDTGSTNISEIEYARQLGMDVIVTDHHTLPPERPPVTAIINPRYLPTDHKLFHLSGVAVAYKLVEALYQTLPHIPQQPLEELLDLVAIGLIADLVELRGDCRYLAQRGIEQLQQDVKQPPMARRRPGVGRLLELCQKSGDRPTDISFGLGPRINAVSRIQGDASFCVQLLTSHDISQVNRLAEETELANARRKALQKEVSQQVKALVKQLDLSTTSVIVLEDPQWPIGVLGLVAGQVAQETGRPTILLSTEEQQEEKTITADSPPPLPLARGSARSVNQIDLYQLVKDQAHLLHRFGGHPFAAGLSLPIENIPLFTEAINQRSKLILGGGLTPPVLQVDLVCKVRDLGKDLFRELKLLEPCGMGNPVPKLLIKNCWFENAWHRNAQDARGGKVQYIKTEFAIRDDSTGSCFAGIWWGHYKDELPTGRCDVVAELDYNTYKNRYEIRLIAVRQQYQVTQLATITPMDWILDWRRLENHTLPTPDSSILTIQECPTNWDTLRAWFRRALHLKQRLALAWGSPQPIEPHQIWQQLVGIAKYLSRTGQTVTRTTLRQKLSMSDQALQLGFQALIRLGFKVTFQDQAFRITTPSVIDTAVSDINGIQAIERFMASIKEEQFQQQYFYEVPLPTIQAIAAQIHLLQNEKFLV